MANEIASHCSRRSVNTSAGATRNLLSPRLSHFPPHAVTLGLCQDFVSSVLLSEAEKASLINLKPAFEHLLRDVGLEESTILANRHCRINDRETFTGLADSPEELRSISADVGINLKDGGMRHKREFSKVLMEWKRTKAQVEVKTSTEAQQKQHGEPIRMLPEDWTSVMVQFKTKYGTNLKEEELPAQGYFEEFQEKLATGMLHAEPLDQIISQAEAEDQDRKKPELRQNWIHLNASLTTQTRRRYTSTPPANLEDLRAKYEVLSNCWLLDQQRQPGRLGQGHNDLHTDPDGKPLVAPPWSRCLSYEYEPRCETYKKCQTIGISAAWWGTYGDPGHRMRSGLSLSAWPTPHQQHQTRRWRTWCKERSQRSSGTAVLTEAALRATGNRATISQIPKVVDEVARDARSLQQLALPSASPKTNPKSKRRARQEGRPTPTSRLRMDSTRPLQEEAQMSRTCSTETKATVSASLFKKAIVKSVHRAPGNTSALDVGEPVGTISASDCRPGWRHLTQPQRHRLLSVKLHRPSLSRLSLS